MSSVTIVVYAPGNLMVMVGALCTLAIENEPPMDLANSRPTKILDLKFEANVCLSFFLSFVPRSQTRNPIKKLKGSNLPERAFNRQL